jgi:hypothetical protein
MEYLAGGGPRNMSVLLRLVAFRIMKAKLNPNATPTVRVSRNCFVKT